MLKYIVVAGLLIAQVGCQNDNSNSEGSTPEQMQGEMQDQMSNQMSQNQDINTDVSDEELDEFVGAMNQAQGVQAEAQQEMLAVVEKEEIDVDTYNQIAQSVQMGQSKEDLDIEEEDMQKFEKASAEIDEIEKDMDGKMTLAIESEGMSMDRFQEINLAIQQDPDLQQRIQQKIQPQMEQPQQGN
ncbi:MAG: DUF4168 domain-containing protein [Balneolales bacterium]